MGDATWQGGWWEPLAEMIQAKMEETKRRWENEREARERTASHHQSRHEHRKTGADWPFGPGPGPFGPGFPFGPGWGGRGFSGPRRGPRRARGDVRDAVLALLSEQPMHGYQIIQEITRRSGEAWRPSPGSVYPTLAQLEDEGLVRTEQSEGRRVVHLTDEGRAYVDSHADELGAIWRQFESTAEEERTHPLSGLRDVAASVAAAVMQVAVAGDSAQQEEVKAILTDTRRRIYRILADADDVWEESVERPAGDEGDTQV